MIEPVALGQTRFNLPGLSVDERGVAMGLRLVCLFPELGSAVGFFRGLSRQGALKDILPTLVVEEAVGEGGVKDVAVAFEVQGSFAADPCAAAARASGGMCFTGTERHFVPYRDSRRPLGCDVAELGVLIPGEGGTVLYQEGGPDVRRAGKRWEFKDLVLSLCPVPLRAREQATQRLDVVVLRVPPGLLPVVRTYLWRRRVNADLAMARAEQKGVFADGGGEVALIRCADVPPGVLGMLGGTPGVEVYVPVTDNVLVQRGYRHPVALDACSALFPRDEVVLFAAGRRTVERLKGPLHPVALDDVMEVVLTNDGGQALPPAPVVPVGDLDRLPVAVRLVKDRNARGTSEAVLIPHDRLAELLALVHLLPQVLWFGCELALARPFTVVLSPAGIRALPIGLALTEVHSRVFVPVGMRFSPRLSDELMVEHMGLAGNDNLVFFPPPGQGGPFAVSRSSFQPLSRTAVHPEELSTALAAMSLLPSLEPVQDPVVHHPPGAEWRSWDGLKTPSPSSEAPAGPGSPGVFRGPVKR